MIVLPVDPREGGLVLTEMADLIEKARQSVGLRVRDQDIDALRGWLIERAEILGLSLGAYARLFADNGNQGRSEREKLTVRLTTGETYFFRDPALFSLIGRELIPRLMLSRSEQRKLKFLSAGCSTGEEAYTLAMLVMEHSELLAGWDIEIVATDINARALDVARSGVYRDWSFRALDEATRNRYFRPSGHHWELDKSVRQRVRFVHLDLHKDAIPNPDIGIADFDMILCRNVFIYMQPEVVASVSTCLTEALVNDGILIAGHGELLGQNVHGLHAKVFPEAVVFHKKLAVDAECNFPVQAAPLVRQLSAPPSNRPERKKNPPASVPEINPGQQPEYQTLMDQAWMQANRGQGGIAKELCERASTIQPLDPWPYYLCAQLAQEVGNVSQARAMLERVIYLDPAHIAALIELAALWDHAGNISRAGRMRKSACQALRGMDPATKIRPYEDSLAGEMLAYLENHFGHPQESAAPPHPLPLNTAR